MTIYAFKLSCFFLSKFVCFFSTAIVREITNKLVAYNFFLENARQNRIYLAKKKQISVHKVQVSSKSVNYNRVFPIKYVFLSAKLYICILQ